MTQQSGFIVVAYWPRAGVSSDFFLTRERLLSTNRDAAALWPSRDEAEQNACQLCCPYTIKPVEE